MATATMDLTDAVADVIAETARLHTDPQKAAEIVLETLQGMGLVERSMKPATQTLVMRGLLAWVYSEHGKGRPHLGKMPQPCRSTPEEEAEAMNAVHANWLEAKFYGKALADYTLEDLGGVMNRYACLAAGMEAKKMWFGLIIEEMQKRKAGKKPVGKMLKHVVLEGLRQKAERLVREQRA